MWAFEFENFSDSLSACDFSQAAINVFKILGLTERTNPISAGETALSFVYEHLPSNLVLTQEEREILSDILQIAHLFDASGFIVEEPSFRCFSVDLGFNLLERSYVQYAVHSIIARKSHYCSAVLFRNRNTVSVSVAYDKENKNRAICLSDWFELGSEAMEQFVTEVGLSDFSLHDGIAFACDLIYQIAREYYIRPLSYEYLKYELNRDENYLTELIEKYGDDYIADAYIEAINTNIDTSDEIDFDLLEYELEQMEFPESEDFDDNGFDDSPSSFPTESIPKDALVDPVLLLKWLDEHSQEKTENVDKYDETIVRLIQAAGIDYIDHREKGGSLWIFGGYELADFVSKRKESGCEFQFKEGGGKATGGFDAWWSKSS
ncbi:MAG: hypothetical protein LBE89_04685 [Helicobacteraceae bacterium]|jgi:hypothetical protein|nr:hypothetical protein [Helicobacteraceae bacterium]